MGGEKDPLVLRSLVAGLIVGAGAFVLWRTVRMGTVVYVDHVELRELWGTTEVPWGDVTHIDVVPTSELDIIDGGPREAAMLCDRTGRRLNLLCVDDKALGRRRDLQNEIEAIRATWLAALRSGHN